MPQNFLVIDKASELTPEALSFLKEFDQKYFPTPWTSKDWDKLFDSHERFLLIDPNGFALFETSVADSFAHLLKIVVNPSMREKGLGKKIFLEAESVLCMRGIKNFFLEVDESNIGAIKLYEGQGFKVIHRKKHFYSSGATALIMTKSI